ncbi:virion protein V67 [Equid alphaherpesvirus 4]|uniref:Virion protein V67 n=1 Tax=Equid alphaherpesvirus 4 TaxID=10331 RepID=A0A0X9ZZ97_9ALPH|nr:virion protein V67 [Equid alphaherpesvirus 4]AMB16029.1 virion protein V67 [Equid alphaherpesvirus 4]AMB16661.1 virion protein V67 [Equid alphaherpesvirus 4]AMB16740.1 virion protein V67 [Equid alphaherpesvirus 4]AMB16819.1 virion protein V67 [Equid alphaherpesvirus 4]
MSSDMLTAATAGTEVFRCNLARRRNANPPHLVLAPTFSSATVSESNAKDSASQEPRKYLFNPYKYMLGRPYFRRCREEMNEGYFAKVPEGYFPVGPSEMPGRVPVESKVDGEVLSFKALPPPKFEKRFYKQLDDGTFVRLPFLYPEEYYEGENQPSETLYYIRADTKDAYSVDPSDLLEEAFAEVPKWLEEEMSNWTGPKKLPIPSRRYVLKHGWEFQSNVTEDAFQEINTTFLRLDLQGEPKQHTRNAQQSSIGDQVLDAHPRDAQQPKNGNSVDKNSDNLVVAV